MFRNIMKALACFSVLLLGACTSFGKMDPEPPLYGMVYDLENQPVQNAEVFVAGKLLSRTDINGRFSLSNLTIGSTYSLEIRKTGYEGVSEDLEYSSFSKVIYLKVASSDQLLRNAEEAIKERRWSEARTLIERALVVQPENPVARFLHAVLSFRTGEPLTAFSILTQLVDEDYREPSIHLFLADILEYRLSNPKDAAKHLTEYLKMRYDSEVEKRLSTLNQYNFD